MKKVVKENFDVVTHMGAFHSDEVVGTILLGWALNKPELKIARVGKITDEHKDKIVYDIGGGEFDHHFEPKKMREDGRLYSSAGLIWNKFKKNIINNMPITEEEKTTLISEIEKGNDIIDEKLIYPIDAMDNGISLERPTPFGGILSSLAYIDNKDRGFELACEFVEPILFHMIKNETSKLTLKNEFEKYLEKSKNNLELSKFKILILDKFVPWKDFLFADRKDKDINFVIYPSLRGGFMAEAVSDGPLSFKNKKPFPEAWRGKSGKDLQDVSGIEDAIFCHMTGFCFSAENINNVIKACEIASK